MKRVKPMVESTEAWGYLLLQQNLQKAVYYRVLTRGYVEKS